MHKYESDLTTKEKKLLQWKTFKELPFREKPGHLWAYHKFILALPVITIALTMTVNAAIQNARMEAVLNIAITDSFEMDVDVVTKEIEKLLNIESPFSQILVDPFYFSHEGQFDHATMQKFVVMISSQNIDILISTRYIYERYIEQYTFMNLTKLFDEEELASVSLIDRYAIDITEFTWATQSFGIWYEPAYFMVIVNVELDEINPEGISRGEVIRRFLFDVIKNEEFAID